MGYDYIKFSNGVISIHAPVKGATPRDLFL